MFWYVVFGFLAAFGLLCALWVLFGLILPATVQCDAAVVCQRGREIAVIRRFCRLRELGLTKANLTVLDSSLNAHQRRAIRKRYPYIHFCTAKCWQERECTYFGTGNADPAGNHCRSGLSEL